MEIKFHHSIKLLFLSGLLTCFLACKDNDSPKPLATSFSCQLNGVDWTSDELSIKIKRQQKSTNVFANVLTLTSKQGDANSFTLTVNDVRDALNQDCMSADTYWGYDEARVLENYSVEDGGILYQNGAAFELQPSLFTNEASFLGKVIIDACAGNKISGQFNFQIKHSITDSVIYEITNGVFTEQTFEFEE
ncbi:MAG: hypothetical protein AB8G15_08955 [Saprospiraceae bacterium]